MHQKIPSPYYDYTLHDWPFVNANINTICDIVLVVANNFENN